MDVVNMTENWLNHRMTTTTTTTATTTTMSWHITIDICAFSACVTTIIHKYKHDVSYGFISLSFILTLTPSLSLSLFTPFFILIDSTCHSVYQSRKNIQTNFCLWYNLIFGYIISDAAVIAIVAVEFASENAKYSIHNFIIQIFFSRFHLSLSLGNLD